MNSPRHAGGVDIEFSLRRTYHGGEDVIICPIEKHFVRLPQTRSIAISTISSDIILTQRIHLITMSSTDANTSESAPSQLRGHANYVYGAAKVYLSCALFFLRHLSSEHTLSLRSLIYPPDTASTRVSPTSLPFSKTLLLPPFPSNRSPTPLPPLPYPLPTPIQTKNPALPQTPLFNTVTIYKTGNHRQPHLLGAAQIRRHRRQERRRRRDARGEECGGGKHDAEPDGWESRGGCGGGGGV